MKVLISDKTSEKGLNILKEAGIDYDVKTGLNEEEIIQIIGDYDAQIVRSETKDTAKILKAGKKLRIIGRAGVGVDNIDVPTATKQGIIVVNSPEGNTIAAAEHTMAMLLALARNIPMAYAALLQKRWDRSKYTGIEVYNKVLGIVGLGKIGQRVGVYAQAFGMQIIAYDPFVSNETAMAKGIKMVSLPEIYQQADFITLHLPKTPETENLINKDTFALMKDGVRIVNCARGGIVNEADLVEAIESGKVAGAAIDVFSSEPATPDNPLLSSDKIVFTPHLGASTKEAQVNVAIDVAEQIRDVLLGGQAKSAVNIPSLKPEILMPVARFMPLSEKLGCLLGQLTEPGVREITIEYSGELAGKNVTPLTTAFLKGFLGRGSSDSVNFVNAPLIAKEIGLKLIESKIATVGEYSNLIEAKVKIGSEVKSVAGNFSDPLGELIVNINGYKISAKPEGFLLVVPNEDKPGVIGKIGSLLGTKQVNIASMHVGRESSGGSAIMIISVDMEIDKGLLAEVAKLEGIIGTPKLVKF